MPQLDPTPWFKILVLTWMVFLTLIPLKVLSHETPNELASQSSKIPMVIPWDWPWY